MRRQSLLGPKSKDSSQHKIKARKWWQQQDADATSDDDTYISRRASFGSYQPEESDLEQDWWDEQEYEAAADIAPEMPTKVMSLSYVLPAVASASGKSKQQLIHPAMELQHRQQRTKKKVATGAHWWQQDYGFLPARDAETQDHTSEPATITLSTSIDSAPAKEQLVSREQVALPVGVMRGSAFMAVKARAAESRGSALAPHDDATDNSAAAATVTTTTSVTPPAHVAGAGAATAVSLAPSTHSNKATITNNTNNGRDGDANAHDVVANDWLPKPPSARKSQWQEQKAEAYRYAGDTEIAPPELYVDSYSGAAATDDAAAAYSTETELETEPQRVAYRKSRHLRSSSSYGRYRRYQKAEEQTAENDHDNDHDNDGQQSRTSAVAQNPDSSVKNAVNEMLRLLTQREYSELELRTKCKGRFTPEAIDAAMRYCQEHNYQSEKRYGEMLVRHMEFTHSGPLKLRLKARQKGVDSELTTQLSSEVNWDELAYQALCKKYGVQVLDYATQRKALAYLGRRGFASSSCLYALHKQQQEARETLANENEEGSE